MTENKGFANLDTPGIIDTEYRHCLFSHTNPVSNGGQFVGHRLFPGDDTPRVFVGCNLLNCEPPPGSTVIKCNTTIVQPKLFISAEDGVEIDGEILTVNNYERVVYGRWTPFGYEYWSPVKRYTFSEEAP